MREKMRPMVKICGLMNAADVRMCVRYGADIIGLVVDYPRTVPWNISLDQAKELIAATPKSAQTCVVTGGSADKILHIAMETKPNYVQLHYAETLADTLLLVHELGKHGIKIIKTVFPNTPDLEKTAAHFCAAGVYALLFDQRVPDNAVNNTSADITTFIKLKNAVSCPVILAGGITPQNISEIILKTGAQIVDLMTGVERCYGFKDEAKVKALFKALGQVSV